MRKGDSPEGIEKFLSRVAEFAMLSSMGAYFYIFMIVITVWHGIGDFLRFAGTNFLR